MSMVWSYDSTGPDIDAPVNDSAPSIQDLITSISVLNFDHAHSPSPWKSNEHRGSDEGCPHSRQSISPHTCHSAFPNSQLFESQQTGLSCPAKDGQTGLTGYSTNQNETPSITSQLASSEHTGFGRSAKDGQTGLTGYSTRRNETPPINSQLCNSGQMGLGHSAKGRKTGLAGLSRAGNEVIPVAAPITEKPAHKPVTVYETIC